MRGPGTAGGPAAWPSAGAVRGFLGARLDALWAGPAGLFLGGGHPAGLARLLRGNVLVTGGGLADQEARTFLAGVLLIRLAEQPSPSPDRSGGVVVIAVPGRVPGPGQLPGPDHPPGLGRKPGLGDVLGSDYASGSGHVPGSGYVPGWGEPAGSGQQAFLAGPEVSPRRAAWFGWLLEDLRRAGTDVVIAAAGEEGSSAPRRFAATAAVSPADTHPAGSPPGLGVSWAF